MRTVMVCFLAACVLAGTGVIVKPASAERSLNSQARWVASHGGIHGSCFGCASPRMKHIVRLLIARRFKPAGGWAVRKALCVSRRESGDNPGAISSTDDHGVAQIHRASYHPFNYYRLTHDPVYSVAVFWRVSARGRDWSPWSGGRYAC